MFRGKDIVDFVSKILGLVTVSLASPGHPVATSLDYRSVVADSWPLRGYHPYCGLVGYTSRLVNRPEMCSATAAASRPHSGHYCWPGIVATLSCDGLRSSCSVAKYSKASCSQSMVDLDRRTQPHEFSIVFEQYVSMRRTCISEYTLVQDHDATLISAFEMYLRQYYLVTACAGTPD